MNVATWLSIPTNNILEYGRMVETVYQKCFLKRL